MKRGEVGGMWEGGKGEGSNIVSGIKRKVWRRQSWGRLTGVREE